MKAVTVKPHARTSRSIAFQAGFNAARNGAGRTSTVYSDPDLAEAFELGWDSYQKKMKVIRK